MNLYLHVLQYTFIFFKIKIIKVSEKKQVRKAKWIPKKHLNQINSIIAGQCVTGLH